MNTFTCYRSKYLIVSIAFLLSALMVIRFGFTVPEGIKTRDKNRLADIKSIFSGSLNTVFTNPADLKTSLYNPNSPSDVYHFSDDDNFSRSRLNLPRYVRLKK